MEKGTEIKLVDLSYYLHTESSKLVEIIRKIKEGFGYINYINRRMNILVIKHMNYEGKELINDVPYFFFKSKGKFLSIPFRTHAFIKKQAPHIILAQGLIFPLQLIALRLQIRKKCIIIVQHHGEKPFKGVKKYLQQFADHYVNAYFFTAAGNAQPFIDSGIIRDKSKIYEVLEASTYFEPRDKAVSKLKCGVTGNYNFLWVGRLDANKNPLLVLNAFEKYVQHNSSARLYMIYQTEDLLSAVKEKIENSFLLKASVVVVGKVVHEELPYWYSGCEFYVAASCKEGSGFALLEAMACGCIPVVTDIPSFRKITAEGKYGFLYEPGNEEQLFEILLRLQNIQKENFSNSIINYFNNHLSFESIANEMYRICKDFVEKRN